MSDDINFYDYVDGSPIYIQNTFIYTKDDNSLYYKYKNNFVNITIPEKFYKYKNNFVNTIEYDLKILPKPQIINVYKSYDMYSGPKIISNDLYYSYKFTAFVEGRVGKTGYKLNDQITNIDTVGSTDNNDYINFEDLQRAKYKLISGEYYKYFVPSKTKPMIKSYIYGNVDVVNCGGVESNLKIKCIRSDDNLFIGYYDVLDKKYNIPNLDYNTRYDIILFDESKNIEQQISSYRQPILYETRLLKSIDFYDVIYDKQRNIINISWDINGNYDEICIYKSENTIDLNNLPEPIILYQINSYYDINFNKNEKYYYLISVRLNNTILYSDEKEVNIS